MPKGSAYPSLSVRIKEDDVCPGESRAKFSIEYFRAKIWSENGATALEEPPADSYSLSRRSLCNFLKFNLVYQLSAIKANLYYLYEFVKYSRFCNASRM